MLKVFGLLMTLAFVASANQKESYKDLISKSQNLSLQHDRLQACQILIRAIQKESRSSTAYHELLANLETLGGVFYTDQAQATFAQGESLLDVKPKGDGRAEAKNTEAAKDALDKFQEALKLEEGNMTVLKAIARLQLRNDECGQADKTIKTAEAYDSLSPEFNLLKLQALECHQDFDEINELIESKKLDFEGVEKFMKVFAVSEAYSQKDVKNAKQAISIWEAAAPDYPELYFWKWQVSNLPGSSGPNAIADKASAQKYLQLCKQLTPRKRKTLNLDVDLCKSTDEVESKSRKLL